MPPLVASQLPSGATTTASTQSVWPVMMASSLPVATSQTRTEVRVHCPGSQMQWPGQVQPKGAFRLLGSLITWMGIRQEQRIWTSLKDRLEVRQHRHQPAGSASHLTWLPGSSSLSRE